MENLSHFTKLRPVLNFYGKITVVCLWGEKSHLQTHIENVLLPEFEKQYFLCHSST
jgi:hypothetical protein